MVTIDNLYGSDNKEFLVNFLKTKFLKFGSISKKYFAPLEYLTP